MDIFTATAIRILESRLAPLMLISYSQMSRKWWKKSIDLGDELVAPMQQHARTIEIVVNKKPVSITQREHTGLEIKQAAIAAGLPVQVDFVLTEIHGNSPNRPTIALRYIARDRCFVREVPRKSEGCRFCGLRDESGFALGDLRELVSTQR